MAGVNRPLTRRTGPWHSYVEPISLVSTEAPTTNVVISTYPIAINQISVVSAVSPVPLAHAEITRQLPNFGTVESPAPTASAYFGGVVFVDSLVPVASITMTIPVVMRVAVESPSPLGSASGTVGGVMGASGTSPSPTAAAHFGGFVAVTSPAPTASASGTVGGVLRVYAVSPEPLAAAIITEEAVMRVNVVSPSPVAAPQGSAWVVSPTPVAYAVGHEVVAVTYEAYAINLTTGAVSHYTNYPFDNILRFGSSYYGVSSSGLYLIGGDLDLTVPIEARVKTFATKLGSQNQKRVPYVYSSGRSDGGVIVGVTADEGETYEYESDWGEVVGSTNHRTTVGKGIKGVYYSFDVKNVNGGSLELDEISVHVAPTQRAI